jgi:2-polyprenyl-3-methyl-5-hydroxy-6-metoxy-1,4-benzoquinol methylase
LDIPEFGYTDAGALHTVRYLKPVALKMMSTEGKGKRLLDVGCGSGYWANEFSRLGYSVVGVDPSVQGIEIARQKFPQARFERTIATDDLLERINEAPFDVVTSFEVIEHVYEPRDWASACFNSLKPGGLLICSTPYHGYLKNLALAVTNGWDRHLGPLWSGGHIKFFSVNTLSQLLREAGFVNPRFKGAGRAPYLWMSMVMAADKPG